MGNRLEEEDYSHLGATFKGDLFRIGLTRTDVTYVCNPTRLGYRIKDELVENKIKLINHIRGEYGKGFAKPVVNDITDQIFDIGEDAKGKSKYTIRSILQAKTKFLKIPNIKHSTGKVILKLLFKYDCPSVQDLKALAKSKPKIEVLMYDTDIHERSFAIVITTDEGWLYYNSIYGSKILLRTAAKKFRG